MKYVAKWGLHVLEADSDYLGSIAQRMMNCDGFSHVVSNKSTMQVNRKTSYFCMQDKEPLLLRGHTRART
jgi:hypothetical protein